MCAQYVSEPLQMFSQDSELVFTNPVFTIHLEHTTDNDNQFVSFITFFF